MPLREPIMAARVVRKFGLFIASAPEKQPDLDENLATDLRRRHNDTRIYKTPGGEAGCCVVCRCVGFADYWAKSRSRRWALVAIAPHGLQLTADWGGCTMPFDARLIAIMRLVIRSTR